MAAGADRMRLAFQPLTPALWPALEDLFGPRGACGGCWCMYWRVGSHFRRRTGAENKAAFRTVLERGPPPGFLAFAGDLPVGWCQLTPREALPGLERPWRLRRVDDVPAWSLSCLYVRKGWRRQGVATALTMEALRRPRRAGAPALEAYPFDAAVSPSATGTGYASTFARAGFKEVARRAPPRPIMRHDLRGVR
jgi:GNAT superfamily N-acetyltransferase